MTTPSSPPPAEVVRTRLSKGLSLPTRIRLAALLLASIAMAGITGTLAATEIGLPLRTRLTLTSLCVIGVAWTLFATWVLTRRVVLYAHHRVVVGWIAVVFSALLTAGCLFWEKHDGGNAWSMSATVVGGVMLTVATFVLHRARTAQRALIQRREVLAAAIRDGSLV